MLATISATFVFIERVIIILFYFQEMASFFKKKTNENMIATGVPTKRMTYLKWAP